MLFWVLGCLLLVVLLLGNVPVFIALLGVTFQVGQLALDVQGAIVIQQFVSGMQSVPLPHKRTDTRQRRCHMAA